MIADFRFTNSPDRDDILLNLFWSGESRMGRIHIPEDIELAMMKASLPATDDLPLISALGFAVYLAGESGRRLCLTGDRSAWRNCWGELIDLGHGTH